jgi:hypothetical protein
MEPNGGQHTRTSIGHGQQEGFVMLERKIFVLKLFAVNRFTSSAIVRREITTLAHELFDHSVEGGILVIQRLFGHARFSLLASAEGTEILGGLGNDCFRRLGRG